MKKIDGKYYGTAIEINDVSDMEDLDIYNCMDTGMQYRFFEGKWFKQPGYWVDRDDKDSGSGRSGGLLIHTTLTEPEAGVIRAETDKTFNEIWDVLITGAPASILIDWDNGVQTVFAILDANREEEACYLHVGSGALFDTSDPDEPCVGFFNFEEQGDSI